MSSILNTHKANKLTYADCPIPFKTIFASTIIRSNRIIAKGIVMARIRVRMTFIYIFNISEKHKFVTDNQGKVYSSTYTYNIVLLIIPDYHYLCLHKRKWLLFKRDCHLKDEQENYFTFTFETITTKTNIACAVIISYCICTICIVVTFMCITLTFIDIYGKFTKVRQFENTSQDQILMYHSRVLHAKF